MFLNLLTVALAAMGLMGPVVGALAHNAGALLRVLNSACLLRWTYHYEDDTPPTLPQNSSQELTDQVTW